MWYFIQSCWWFGSVVHHFGPDWNMSKGDFFFCRGQNKEISPVLSVLTAHRSLTDWQATTHTDTTWCMAKELRSVSGWKQTWVYFLKTKHSFPNNEIKKISLDPFLSCGLTNQFPTHNVGKSKPVGESVSLFPLLYLKKKKRRQPNNSHE